MQLTSQEMANTSISIGARSETGGGGMVYMKSVTDFAPAIGSAQQNNASATKATNSESSSLDPTGSSSDVSGYSPNTSTGYDPGISSGYKPSSDLD